MNSCQVMLLHVSSSYFNACGSSLVKRLPDGTSSGCSSSFLLFGALTWPQVWISNCCIKYIKHIQKSSQYDTTHDNTFIYIYIAYVYVYIYMCVCVYYVCAIQYCIVSTHDAALNIFACLSWPRVIEWSPAVRLCKANSTSSDSSYRP